MPAAAMPSLRPRRAGNGRGLRAVAVLALIIAIAFVMSSAFGTVVRRAATDARLDLYAVTAAARRKLALHGLGQPVTFTTHFTVYTVGIGPQDAGDAGAAAEQAWTEVVSQGGEPAGVDFARGGRIPLVVTGGYRSLAGLLQLQAQGATAGAEQDGVVYIVRPSLDAFPLAGDGWAETPLVHELTHYWLEKEAGDNYPRWFTEGLAQWAQYRATGELLPAPDGWAGAAYSLADLTARFDSLDQGVAYRESFSLVQYMVHKSGPGAPWQVSRLLRDGERFGQAVKDVTGLDVQGLWSDWHQWVIQGVGAGVATSP